MHVNSAAPQKPAQQGAPASTVKTQPAQGAASFAQALDDLGAAPVPAPPQGAATHAQAAGRKAGDKGARAGDASGAPAPAQTAKTTPADDAAEGPEAHGKRVARTHDDDGDAGAADLAALLPGWQPPADAGAADTAQAGGKHTGADALRAGAKGGKGANAADEAQAALGAAADGRSDKTAAAGSDFGAALAAAAQSAEARGATHGNEAGQAAARPGADAAQQAPAAALPAAALPSFAPAAADAASTPFQAHLAAAVTTPDFAPALGAQVSILAKDGIQEARLHLNPAEMGPIAIRIELDGAQARVAFTAEHAATRAAIEQGLPDLAAALQDAGLTLTGGGVFEQSQQQQGQARDGQPGRGATSSQRTGDTSAGEEAERALPRRASVRHGGVDLVA